MIPSIRKSLYPFDIHKPSIENDVLCISKIIFISVTKDHREVPRVTVAINGAFTI